MHSDTKPYPQDLLDDEELNLNTYEDFLEKFLKFYEDEKDEYPTLSDGKYPHLFPLIIHPEYGKQPPAIIEPYLAKKEDRSTLFELQGLDDLFIETIHEHHPDLLEIFAKYKFPFFNVRSQDLPHPNLLASAIRFNNLSTATFLLNLDYLDDKQKSDALFEVMSSLCIRGHHAGHNCDTADMTNGLFDEETLVSLMQFCLANGAKLNTRRFELIKPESFRILLTAQLSLGRDIKDLLNTDLARSELFRRRLGDLLEDCHDSIYDVALLLLLDEQSIILTDNITLLEPASKHPYNKHLTNDVSGAKTSLQSIFRPEEAREKALELKENALKYQCKNASLAEASTNESQNVTMSNPTPNQREQGTIITNNLTTLTSATNNLNQSPENRTNQSLQNNCDMNHNEDDLGGMCLVN